MDLSQHLMHYNVMFTLLLASCPSDFNSPYGFKAQIKGHPGPATYFAGPNAK